MNTITSTTFPEAAGISASCIIDALREIDIREVSMHSFLLCKDDCLVAEGYYAPVKKNLLQTAEHFVLDVLILHALLPCFNYLR